MNKINIIQYASNKEVDALNSILRSKNLSAWYALVVFEKIYLISRKDV